MLARKTAVPLIALGALFGAIEVARAAEVTTLWNFLGIPQSVRRIQGATINRRGNLPGLEPKPWLKSIADPRNLESKNPAIKKAAEIKTEEDLAKQKIKAIKYLAKIGCGCYPGVKEALLAALDDCTEKVRYQAALALAEAACNHCETCNRNCCCDEEVTKRLSEIAYEKNDECCWLEPSERVREAAKQAMFNCCSMARDRGGYPIEEGETPPPTGETPGQTPTGETPGTTPSGEAPPPADPPPPPPSPEARSESPDLILSSASNRPVQPAPSKVMAEKMRGYRQRAPRLQAASTSEAFLPKPAKAEPQTVVAAQPQPLEIASAIAVLQQLPTNEAAEAHAAVEADEEDIEPTSIATDAQVVDEKLASSQTQVVATAAAQPRYALVTAIAEPQRPAPPTRSQPTVRPAQPVKRFPWQ